MNIKNLYKPYIPLQNISVPILNKNVSPLYILKDMLLLKKVLFEHKTYIFEITRLCGHMEVKFKKPQNRQGTSVFLPQHLEVT